MSETVWSISMELVRKLYELTKDKKLCDEYEVRLMKAYRNDSDKIEKAHKQDLEYFCGRSTFYPYEC